ncbi:hypothetical protein, partial [Enterobacter kobei]|uniref:hypothetical protein n=1 Tax=Enterobacter kobei TaxID=208224 RepID=UPI00403F6D12
STIASIFLINLLLIHFSINNISKKTSALLITKLYLACNIFTAINIKRDIARFKKEVKREAVSTNLSEKCVDIIF